MNNRLILQISKSLLIARWRQTLIAAIGVTFGITMFITLLGFMNGLNELLDGLMMNRTPHVRLYNDVLPSKFQPVDLSIDYDDTYNFIESIKPKKDRLAIRNAKTIIDVLEKDDKVLGVAPKIASQLFYNIGAINITGVVNGIEVDEEKRLFFFDDYVVKGDSKDLDRISNSIIIGTGVADIIMADVGDVIQISTIHGKIMKLKVVGLFQSGVSELDKVQSYASISTTQKILGESSSYITDIQIKLKDINTSLEMAKYYSNLFDVEAIDIIEVNAQFDTGSSIRSMISYAVGITLLIVAGFGIYNILNMLIYEKMDSIAILKATGFSGKDVSRIFIYIALIIGLFGGVLGLLLGFGLCNLIDHIPFDTEALPTIKTYPIRYSSEYYIIGGLFAIITTYFAGYFPSRKASKIDPVEIIRGK
jgi:lipoprotein-releasing system permease protein